MTDEKQVVYSKESLVDITTDSTTSTLGTVEISNGQITLGPKSSVSYEYTYEAGQESSIITDILQLDCSVIGLTDGMTTRYNRYLSILIKVQYYLEVVEGETKVYYDGNTDTFEIYPYLSNESINTSYNIYLQNSYIKKINITYKNNYESDSVKYTDIKLKYSMSLLEAINKYGGGSTFVPGSNSLKFYSVNDKYSIDSFGDSLIMKIDIDENNWEEVVKPYVRPKESTYGTSTLIYHENGLNYPFDLSNPIMEYTADIRWTVRSKSNNNRAFSTDVYGNEQIVYVKENRDLSDDEKTRLRSEVGDNVYEREYNRILNSGDCWSEMKVNIRSRYCKIIGYQTDTLIVRTEYIDAPNIYFEKEIKINNCSVVDFKLTFDNNEMKIHGSNIQFATLEVIPSNLKKDGNDAANLSCIAYDETGGKAIIVDDDGNEYNKVNYKDIPARVKIKGRNNGKVLFTAKTDGLYPSGFSKSWIVEVVDVPEITDLYTKTPNGTVIDATKEYIDIIVGTNRNKNLHVDSKYGLESLDGVGQGYVTLLNSSNNKELTYRVYPLAVGKIKFWGNMQEDRWGDEPVGRVEVNIGITALYKELTTNLTTNTGLFEITEGAGQLEVYCTPNYNYAGRYSFSQVSVDGGNVDIYGYENKVRITADREGQTTLICKPEHGPAVSHIITISNQYPKDVELTTPDNVDMIVTGGQLTVTGTPDKPYNDNFYIFNWTFDKVNPEVDYDIRYGDYRRTATITGRGLGLLRVNCYREVDNKFLTSRIFKIVQSIGSIEVNLPYPDTKTNWVLFRRRDQNNSLFLGTLNGAVTKCTYIGESIDYDATMTELSQYNINDDGKTWRNIGNWSNDKNMTTRATELIASSVDVYDSDNMLILTASEYKTINFADIIYGVGHIRIKLRTSKKTVFTNTEVKIEALNYDDTIAYDWQFVGTDVTVVEKTSGYVIFKPTSSGDLKANYIMSESGSVLTGIAFKVIEKPTNLKYIRLYITGAQRNGNPVGFCNISEFDILDSNGNSVLTDSCVYTSDSVYSSSEVTANAFDKNTSTIWHSADNNNAHWLQVEFASGIDLPSSYVVTRRTENFDDKIVTWELQVSTDGSTWLTVDSHINDTDWSSGYTRTFSL